MKKLFSIISISAVLLLMSNSFAQDRYVATDAWGFGFGFTYPMYVGINEASLNTSEFYGGHLLIQRNWSEHVASRIKGAFNHVSAQYYENYAANNGEYVTNNMITGDLDLIYYFNPCEPWVLYLVTGIGINYNKPENAQWDNGAGGFTVSSLDGESNTAAQFNLGAGIEIKILGMEVKAVSLVGVSLVEIPMIVGYMLNLDFFIISARANLLNIVNFIPA